MGKPAPEPFVGREDELALLEDMLARARTPGVLHLHGPGGIGKTKLLQRFFERLLEEGVRVCSVDAVSLPAGPQGMLRAVVRALGVDATRPDELAEALTRDGAPRALAIDAVEALGPRLAWLREVLLPALPLEMPVLIAGRQPPGAPWMADAGWAELLRIHRLGPLDAEASEAYLAARGVGEGQRDAIVPVARGHPLALAVAAEGALQEPSRAFRPLDQAALLERLLERFLSEVPSAKHREALEAASLLDHVTEDLLAAMLGARDAPMLFDWLASLSFVMRAARGLSTHALVRDCVGAALVERDRERYRRLVARARDHLARIPGSSSEPTQSELLLNQAFLLSHVMPIEGLLPRGQPFGALPPGGCVAAEQLDVETWGTLEQLIRRQLGEASVVRMRAVRPWATVRLLRDAQGHVAGFSLALAVDAALPDAVRDDPALRGLMPLVERTLARDRGVCLIRFWTTRDGDTGPWVSPTMHGFFEHTEDMRDAALAAATLRVERFATALAHSELRVFPGAEYDVEGTTFGWAGLELGEESMFEWRVRHHTRILGVVGPARPAEATAPRGFRRHLMQAMRALHDPVRLAESPLIELVIVRQRCPNGDAIERAGALRALLIEQQRMFEPSARDRPVAEVIRRTYDADPPTQREIASALGMSFSVYRRHLTSGVRRMADALWELENEALP